MMALQSGRVRCRIRELSADRNVSLTRVSVESGVNRDTLSRLANGRIKGIEFKTITALCCYFGVPINELFVIEGDSDG